MGEVDGGAEATVSELVTARADDEAMIPSDFIFLPFPRGKATPVRSPPERWDIPGPTRVPPTPGTTGGMLFEVGGEELALRNEC